MRPPLERESGQFPCVSIPSASSAGGPAEIVVGSNKPFTFDNVFGTASTQQEVYDACVRPLLSSFLLGVNVCLFCYGQTGSGKTWTVGSGNVGNVAAHEQGLIPRTAAALFEALEAQRAASPDDTFTVRVSFLEIYGDEIRE